MFSLKRCCETAPPRQARQAGREERLGAYDSHYYAKFIFALLEEWSPTVRGGGKFGK